MKPFLHGRKSLSVPSLRFPHIPAGVSAQSPEALRTHAAAHEGAGGVTVEVVKEGDKVARLLVTCACGEKIEIDCIYPVGS